MKYIFLLLLFLTSLLGNSQNNNFPIWGGFSNNFTINHRLSRIGSFVTNYEVCNTSATGTGKDSTFYETNYLTAQSEKLISTPGNATFWLKGKEKDSLFAKKDFKYYVGNDVSFYTVALAGFDIVSLQKADRLELLQFKITNEKLINDTVHFSIEVLMIDNCQSPECPRFKNTTLYELSIYYQVLTAKSKDVKKEEVALVEKFFWSKKPQRKTKAPWRTYEKNEGKLDYDFAIFKSLYIELDKAHHFAEMGFILDQSKSPNQLDYKLHYKQSNFNMKKASFNHTASRLAFFRSGKAMMKVDIELITNSKTIIKSHNFKGKALWPGRNLAGSTNKAKHCEIINLQNLD